ncbi:MULTISPECIES: hypothetical protein [unclassified Paenibacillus]|uniref:Uncharacterized protein n=1 Tax=Paenibacillus provencensis TaxID=441151 RepID=A0ABW3Q4R1_9BACL|nr:MULTISPECIES: hypothetical protein [unclassified Paenibacillus]MCM3130244.1 hypothetical protein [Paenibacillus sp. MER 78]SDX72452.1 hypothetical protein SAMN05518848_112136 [Paenibacillus sp. PDC88]SFS89306.1 hypothetical protein SAMN04488601_106131 [Paenibacillus sp. 453mf]
MNKIDAIIGLLEMGKGLYDKEDSVHSKEQFGSNNDAIMMIVSVISQLPQYNSFSSLKLMNS